MYPKIDSILCLSRTLFFLCSSKFSSFLSFHEEASLKEQSLPDFSVVTPFVSHTTSQSHLSHHRSQDRSFGRWKDLACVVKRVENEKQRLASSVQNTSLVLGRFVMYTFLSTSCLSYSISLSLSLMILSLLLPV